MEHLILSCLESRLEEGGSLYGRFLLGPLRVGQGLTIATALRRALLSELQGIAITAVTIEGAAHQYSSIVGVRESALDITLNLKQVVLAGGTTGGTISELPAMGYVNVLGPKRVCGSDLRLPNGISCVNRDQHIATVSSNGALLMKFVISSGKSYIIHHSAPAQTLKPSLLRSKARNMVGSLPSPAATRDVAGSRFCVGPKGATDRMGYDARYARHLTRRSVLSSGATYDVVSYLRQRRLATPSMATSSPQGSVEDLEQGRPASPILERDPPVPGPTESASKRLQREPIADNRNSDTSLNPSPSAPFGNSKEDPRGQGAPPFPRGGKGHEGRPQPSRGWPSSPHQGGSLGQKGSKDLFLAALAQKSNRLGKRNGDTYSDSALEPVAGGKAIGFSDAVGDHAVGDGSLLPIDAVFMPVNSVNFSLQTDDQWQEPKERVILEVWTNGSVSPRQALHEAATCLVYMFSLFRQSLAMVPPLTNKVQHESRISPDRVSPDLVSPDRVVEQTPGRITPALPEASLASDDAEAPREGGAMLARQRSRVLKQGALAPLAGEGDRTDLENLRLSVQAYVALKQSGINTLRDLFACPPNYLNKVLGGNKELSLEISAKLKDLVS